MSNASPRTGKEKNYELRFSVVRAVAAMGIALLVTFLLILLSQSEGSFGERVLSALTAIKTLLVNPLFKKSGAFNTKGLTDILAGMVPITFTGLATCIMFSANQFNLGAEGGIMLGAFVGGLVAVYAKLPGILLPITAVLAGAAAVGLMMLIPAVLKVKLGVSEMVCSLMLNYVIMYFIDYVLNTYLADTSKGTIQTFGYQEHAMLPQLIPNGSHLSIAFVIAMLFSALAWLFMYRTRWGYGIRMTGINQPFVMYSGMNVGLIILLSQVLGGILAGMGGTLEQLGRNTSYDWLSLPGYGWTGITVAILAGNNPAYVPLAAFFMSFLSKGCQQMQTICQVPSQLISIIQAVIFVLFAAENFMSGYHQKLVVKGAQQDMARKAAADRGGEK